MSRAVPRPPTRRELLGAGAAGAAGLLAAPGAATATTSTAANATEAPVSDTTRLQRLIRLEMLLLYCYRYVLGSSILGARARSTLAPFPAHEQAHIAALEAPLRARGGSVPSGPGSIAAANHDLAHRKVKGRLGQLKGEHDALNLLRTVEQVMIGAYFVSLTTIGDTELIRLVCQIMGNEAQHDAMIGYAMPKGTLGSAVPYGLVQGLQ